jgi:hypothetical protein
MQVEQELVCGSGSAANMQQAFEDVMQVMNDSSLSDIDRCRFAAQQPFLWQVFYAFYPHAAGRGGGLSENNLVL